MLVHLHSQRIVTIIQMARPLRQKSGTGIYHVMLRGINRQDIFEEEADYIQMVSILNDRGRFSMIHFLAKILLLLKEKSYLCGNKLNYYAKKSTSIKRHRYLSCHAERNQQAGYF